MEKEKNTSYQTGGNFPAQLSDRDRKKLIEEEIEKRKQNEYSVYSLTEEQKIFIATIFGETSVSSNASGVAVANVIMNRLNPSCDKTGYWSKYTTVTDIIINTGFDAYKHGHGDPNSNYSQAMEYMNHPDTFEGYSKIPVFIDQLIELTLPVYEKKANDITEGCVYYYSPELQAKLHIENPSLYKEEPDFFREDVEFVQIEELSATDDFAFYRYK